jgi:hypothetical protein
MYNKGISIHASGANTWHMGTQNLSALTFLDTAWLASTPAARGRAAALGADPTVIGQKPMEET